MKRTLTSIIAALALGAATLPSSAADLPRPYLKAPPAPAPVAFSWTGCYVGGNVGWARGEHDLSTNAPPFPPNLIGDEARATINGAGLASLNADGITGGGQVGCNWQYRSFVLGGEADINFADISADRDTGAVLVPGTTHIARSIDHIGQDWFATFRGRVGWAFDRVLVYGTGGLAVTRLDITKRFAWDFNDGCPPLGTLFECHDGGTSGTRTGWTAGAGVEWAFAPRWSAKAEYLFADFGSVTYQTMNNGPGFVGLPPGQVAFHTVDSKLQIVRVGVNWKFWGP
jgi:outer membrane immunogenic protein